MMSTRLFRNGTVILHGQDDRIDAKPHTDVLVEGTKIVGIGRSIQAPAHAEIIDCTNKIISPGFVDTHHHVWQTQLKGRHANQTLLEYFYTGNFNSSVFTVEDTFWGQLAGCMEMINGGTTTVVDHAHINYGPRYNSSAILATAASGIRSIYAYCPTPRIASWNPLKMEPNLLADFVIEDLQKLASEAPFGCGRITLGFAFDGWFLPKEVILSLFAKVNHLDIRTITAHYVRTASLFSSRSLPELLDDYGLLDGRFLLSHSNHMTSKDIELCHSKGFWISSTPETESQMAHGTPICFDDEIGLQGRCSLGVDCHSNNSGDLLFQMRLALQSARGRSNEHFYKQGMDPRRAYKKVEEVFNLGTIQGARALKMEDQIGSIAVGKLADLVIFDATSVSMICAAQHDPVAAIVLHSSPADIDMVVVGGEFRKRDKRLLQVHLDDDARSTTNKDTLEWDEIAMQLISTRERIQEEIDKHDIEEARAATIKAFHVDESRIAERL